MSTRKSSAIAIALFLSSVLLPISTSAAGGRRRVLTVSPPAPPLTIVFLGTGGIVDAGTIVSTGGRRAARSTRTVTLRIGEPAQEPRGTVTLRAFLETADPRATIRIDGVTLTSAPRVIRRYAPIGVSVVHRIEIEVPVTAAEGPLQASIGWEATTE